MRSARPMAGDCLRHSLIILPSQLIAKRNLGAGARAREAAQKGNDSRKPRSSQTGPQEGKTQPPPRRLRQNRLSARSSGARARRITPALVAAHGIARRNTSAFAR